MDSLGFSYVERHIIFNANVNEAIPINFLLDTGAGQSATFETVAKRLGLAKQDTAEEVKAIAGSQGEMAKTVFSSLKIGGIEYNEVICLILPDHMQVDTSFDAVAGFNVLSKVKILVDFPQQKLNFFKKDESVPLTGMNFVQFHIRENVPIVGTKVDGQLMDALLDTGSGESVVFEKAVEQHNKKKIGCVTLGTDLRFNIELEIQPISEFSRGLNIGAILGNNMWTDCVLFIDYSRRLLGVKSYKELAGPCEDDKKRNSV